MIGMAAADLQAAVLSGRAYRREAERKFELSR
jgi:hypothetical protein